MPSYRKRVRRRISAWKNDLRGPWEVMAEAREPLDVTAAAAYEAYEHQLRAYNAVDLDDMIGLTVRYQPHDQMGSWFTVGSSCCGRGIGQIALIQDSPLPLPQVILELKGSEIKGLATYQ